MATTTTPTTSTARLRHVYKDTIAAQLKDELALENINQAPRLQKIVLNVGLGKAKDDKKVMDAATNTLRKITGQEPMVTIARKSIASFKLRDGMKIGLKVTLRGDRMYEFLDRVVNIVVPRLRDFHGVNPKAFDKQGNYALGFVDQSVFPELSFDETTTTHGLQIIFVISGGSQVAGRALLEKFGMPFEKEKK